MNKTQAVALHKDKAIVRFEGPDFKGRIGIDGRIFKALTYGRISVGIISQQAVENGVSVLVSQKQSDKAVECLTREFEKELLSGEVRMIYSINEVSVLAFNSRNFDALSTELTRNRIFPLLVNQSSTDHRINLVVPNSQAQKAFTILEAELQGTMRTLHLALLGHGNVGGALIGQLLESRDEIKRRKKVDLKIFAVLNSRCMVLDHSGIGEDWQQAIAASSTVSSVEELISYAAQHQLENLVAVDNTGSTTLVEKYEVLLKAGFDLVSSNKVFNTLDIHSYRALRTSLSRYRKKYLYETNVGAGLPLIDTIRLLHLSGEDITRIEGVFSGSLSYVLNRFSSSNLPFSEILMEARAKGLTEPDPREDLSGRDVARKLLILSRELDLSNELEDVEVESLIPEALRTGSWEEFSSRFEALDSHYHKLKEQQAQGHVLRYVGELSGDLQKEKGILKVRLLSVPQNSSLGQLEGSDSLFRIFTASYAERPITIMGAGAGAQVTARGVFGDILRISEQHTN